VNIAGFGTRPVYVGPSRNPDDAVLRMQINIALPPGLDPGETSLQVFYENQRSEKKVISLSEGSEW
jgi:hypothetical protein